MDDEVKSIKQLKTDDVANAVLALVKAIDPSQPFPRTLPRHMSQKVGPMPCSLLLMFCSHRVVACVFVCAHTAPLVAIYTGVIDETIISTSDSLYVRFASDKSIVDKGFNASFSLIDQSTSSSSSSSSLSLVTHSTMR